MEVLGGEAREGEERGSDVGLATVHGLAASRRWCGRGMCLSAHRTDLSLFVQQTPCATRKTPTFNQPSWTFLSRLFCLRSAGSHRTVSCKEPQGMQVSRWSPAYKRLGIDITGTILTELVLSHSDTVRKSREVGLSESRRDDLVSDETPRTTIHSPTLAYTIDALTQPRAWPGSAGTRDPCA